MMSPTTLESLKQAVPYLRLYRGKLFVVKLGGETLATRESAVSLLRQIDTLSALGIKTVVVHGGGSESTELAAKLGVDTQMVEGRRVTSKPMLEVMAMSLNGKVQTQLLAVAKEIGMRAIGLSGLSGDLVATERRPVGKVDFGEVGDVVSVCPELLIGLLEQGYVPFVSPLCCSDKGEVLNVNADTIASELARALGAEKMIFVGGMPGILRDLNDRGSLLSHLTLADLEGMEAAGDLKTGMLPKASAIRAALQGGVERVHLVGADIPDSLLVEVFTNEGCGTLVTA